MSRVSRASDMETNCMMEAHNGEDNAFEAGRRLKECDESRSVVLKNVPAKLKRHAILTLLQQFGTVIKLDIPKNQENFKQHQPGFVMAFADFSKFSEAEKAIREINHINNKSISIRAEFAHKKRNDTEEVFQEPLQEPRDPKAAESPAQLKAAANNPPMTVLYDAEPNDVYERVSAFNYKEAPNRYKANGKQMDMYKKLVAQSQGRYDTETQCFAFNQELLDMFPTKQCSECGNEGLLQCDNTSLIYCSVKCSLLKDEPPFKVPTSSNAIVYGEHIKLNDKVIISGIINEKCVYVRSKHIDFGSLQNDIYKLVKKAPKLEDFPEVGDLVLVGSLGEICRAKVLDVSDDEGYAISVRLIDYGCTAQVFFDELMAMSPALRKIECITHKLLLKDVRLEAINGDVIEYMVKLLKDKTELSIVDLNGNEAVLVAKPSNVSVNQKIMSLSMVKEITYADEGVMFSAYPKQDTSMLGIQQKVYLVNTDISPDPSLLACIPEGKIKDFKELYNAINHFGNNRKSAKMGIPANDDRVCLMQFNGLWHRGIVSKAQGDGEPLCLLFDLLSEQKVSILDIIPMPKAFAKPPPMVEICKVENFNSESAKILKAGKVVMIAEIKEGNEGDIILTIH